MALAICRLYNGYRKKNREKERGSRMGLKEIIKKISSSENGEFSNRLSACVKGKAIPLSEVKDEVFSSEALGKGCGFLPEGGEIYAPEDGRVEMVFPTKHAIGLKTKGGAEVLIHIGINTVELNGEGFDYFVKQGDKVSKGQLLEKFDLEAVKSKGYDTTVIVVVTNSDEYRRIELEEDALVLEKQEG